MERRLSLFIAVNAAGGVELWAGGGVVRCWGDGGDAASLVLCELDGERAGGSRREADLDLDLTFSEDSKEGAADPTTSILRLDGA